MCHILNENDTNFIKGTKNKKDDNFSSARMDINLNLRIILKHYNLVK